MAPSNQELSVIIELNSLKISKDKSMNIERSRIAVFGSWRDINDQKQIAEYRASNKTWSNKNTKENFIKACCDLGVKIAHSGNKIIVASDSTSTIDYHLVHGIIEDSKKSNYPSPPIHIVRSKAPLSSKNDYDCTNIFQQAIDSYPHLFDEPEFFNGTFIDTDSSSKKWEQVHDFVAEQADKILVVGGGSSTYRIAVRALANEKSMIPIGTFGGAGRELISMLENIKDKSYFPKYEYREILSEENWESKQLYTVLYALGVTKDPSERRKIFINYRRDDSSMAAGRIHEKLSNIFTYDDVFIDFHSIKIANRFEEVIQAELNKTAVFLVIIGPEWLKIQNENSGKRRLDEPNDFVRREIEIALRDGIKIIPVCVEGAKVPGKQLLPDSISNLIEWNAFFISTDNFRADVNRLIEDIKDILKTENIYDVK